MMSSFWPLWLKIVGGVVALVGLTLMIWSLRGDRSRGRRRCPKCWYHMQGVPGTRCPECGRESKRERDLLKPRRRWRWAVLALIIMLLAPGMAAYRQFRDRGWYWLLPRYKVASETTIAGWRIAILDGRDPRDVLAGQKVEITRAGRPSFIINDGWRFRLGEVDSNNSTAARVGLGEDITGDGAPDLIVADYSGGAHCCMTYRVLSLADDRVTQLQLIDTQNAGARFADLDGDGLPEMETSDPNFAYWNAPYVGSPKPRIVLKWREGQYRLAPELMRAAAPDDGVLRDFAAAVRNDTNWSPDGSLPPAHLWSRMLELIYTGHADLAWALLADAWPDDRDNGRAARMQFMVDFIAQLSHSQYWEAVRVMNMPANHATASAAAPE